MTTSKPATGPAAMLALFAPEGCRSLKHRSCSKRGCPCDDARAYLQTLPKTATFEAMWNGCTRADWRAWLTHLAKVPDDSSWATIAAALATRLATPIVEEECEGCSKDFDSDDLDDGYCHDCHSERFVYCNACGHDVDRESDRPCNHLIYSDASSDFVGSGTADEPDVESLHNVCVHLGWRTTEKLRTAIARPSKWIDLDERYYVGDSLDDVLGNLRDAARDDDDRANRNDGACWLLTLDSGTTTANAATLAFLDAHLAARRAAAAKDRRPRRVLRDGGGRFWRDGEWTPLRFKARWMSAKRASSLRTVLREAHPGAGLVVVHVLTPAPAFVKKKGDGR